MSCDVFIDFALYALKKRMLAALQGSWLCQRRANPLKPASTFYRYQSSLTNDPFTILPVRWLMVL